MNPAARGVFVSGTGTGVGKTVAGCALVRALRERGIDIGVMKPIETGVGPEGPEDARALRAAAGVSDRLDEICPVSLALPAAPSIAAANEGRRIDVMKLVESYRALAARHESMCVEGAGGLRVPIDGSFDMRELAAHLGLSVLLVARTDLGTVNHTRLSLDSIAARGLALAGVVLNHVGGPLSAADRENLKGLRFELGRTLVGELPPLRAGERPPADAFDLDAIVRTMGGARCSEPGRAPQATA